MSGGTHKLTEIDAIFAGRGRGTTPNHRGQVVQGTATAHDLPSTGPHSTHPSGTSPRTPALVKSQPNTTKKKKKKGKRPANDNDDDDEAAAPVPVVQDPSQSLLADRPSDALKKRKLSRRPDPRDLEERVFRDSRGSIRPTTDDGLPIYSVEELRIGLGQDTPECPFDCRCCF